MSQDLTIDAVRLALTMHTKRAEIASRNVAGASHTGFTAQRVDFSAVEAALRQVANSSTTGTGELAELALETARKSPTTTHEPVRVDAEIGSMVDASSSYQTLSEALSRKFGLMRLAISGRN